MPMTSNRKVPAVIDRIREMRRRARMTLSDVQEATEGIIQPSTLNHYERGRIMPPVAVLIDLARAYGYLPEDTLSPRLPCRRRVITRGTVLYVELYDCECQRFARGKSANGCKCGHARGMHDGRRKDGECYHRTTNA